MEQLETADKARKAVKKELQEANDKLIALEEELFESKSVQKELLEQMKSLEDSMEELVN